MISSAFVQALKNYIPEKNIHIEEMMSAHTTFRVGGMVDCLVEPENVEQLQNLQEYLEKKGIPMFILGNGSNLLVSDDGFRGVVIKIGNQMSKITVDGEKITAQAGATMAQIARAAWEHGLTGLEFAAGIPGTVGGGIVMNAGAYGGEMKHVVEQVTVLTADGAMVTFDNPSMQFGYRTSILKFEPHIVTEVVFVLKKGDKDEIKAQMDDLAAKRRDKQPLEFPSAGSTFKRPEGHFAGELIMNAGLRGYQIGGARVSDKHCGFLINAGGATASDVWALMEYVREKVKEQFGVELEPEVLTLGYFE